MSDASFVALKTAVVIGSRFAIEVGHPLDFEEVEVFARWVEDRSEKLVDHFHLVDHLPFEEVAKTQTKLISNGMAAGPALIEAIALADSGTPLCPPDVLGGA